MKKNYKLPRMRAVEIKESDMLCSTGEVPSKASTMSIEMKDYDTYGASEEPVQGTGSDF